VLWLQKQFPVTFKAFDILSFNSEDITDWPYLKRKDLLKTVISNSRIEYVPHSVNIKALFEETRKQGEEGIILKNILSGYVYERSFDWLKIKNWREEICTVVGYTPGKNARTPWFGSLVLARDGEFRGCVGSGFNDWELRKIKDIFTDSPKTATPFDIGEPYTAVQTNLKVEVKYYKTTEAGVMRFPVFVRVVN